MPKLDIGYGDISDCLNAEDDECWVMGIKDDKLPLLVLWPWNGNEIESSSRWPMSGSLGLASGNKYGERKKLLHLVFSYSCLEISFAFIALLVKHFQQRLLTKSKKSNKPYNRNVYIARIKVKESEWMPIG